MPEQLYRYSLSTTWFHQIPLLAPTAAAFLIEVVPLELQRRIVNDAVKNRQYGAIVLLCAVYAGAVLLQGAIKLAMNIYRGWVGERAKRDLRRRVDATLDGAVAVGGLPETQGTAVSMMVSEVEPVGGFVGTSISEPLLQIGIVATVIAYIVHLDWWMGGAARARFVPQLVFVPLMQRALSSPTISGSGPRGFTGRAELC
ncbi:MAG TPA: hypothetical protein VFX06_05220 [Stellaceae bacterium]|nr:hypothetical protein [Stellaceae bacterium]